MWGRTLFYYGIKDKDILWLKSDANKIGTTIDKGKFNFTCMYTFT